MCCTLDAFNIFTDFKILTMINFNRIVAYGCSITSGFELADDIVYPDIKISMREHKKLKDGIETYFHARTSNAIKEENNRSWMGQLATYLDVECINKAIPGGSCQSSIYLLERDLASRFIKDTDLIIIGQWDYYRWFWINNNNEPQTPTIGGSDLRWPSKNFHNEFLLHLSNKNNLLFNWFTGIKYIDMLSDRLNGRLLQQLCHSLKDDIYYSKIKQFDSFIDCEFSFDNIVDWNDSTKLHCFGHPTVDLHQQFANHIYATIKRLL